MSDAKDAIDRRSGMIEQTSNSQYRVSDELWERMEPLLPKHRNTHRFGDGRPRARDRKCIDAILFVLRSETS
jgi:transposase